MQVFSHNVAASSFGWANDNLDDMGKKGDKKLFVFIFIT